MSRLFEPINLGPLLLKNRLVMTAMSTSFAGSNGEVTERLTEYYATRAAGGVGLVTAEEAYFHPQLPHIKNALGIYSNRLIPGLRTFTRRIHDEGALVSLQIGLHFRQQLNAFPRYVASAKAPDAGPECKELTKEEIAHLVKLFVEAAVRTRDANFDAVEIHACHGCLISEFLSPYWNRRTDDYGGDRGGRFRFALEILTGIRARLGSDFPVIYRISGSEFHADGFSARDSVALSRALTEGGVTAISVSGGLGHVNHIAIAPTHVPRGLLLPLAKDIKEAVRVPVIVANSLTPALAEEAISSDQADLVGLGRPLIADPQWPRKMQTGRAREIRGCIRCNQGCFGGLRDPGARGVTCLYNPQAGLELERPVLPAATPRTIVVIGGGPAGCEVSRVARLRGHRVILLEKEKRLGGQFKLAAKPPKKEDFNALADFYTHELERLRVDVRLNTKADMLSIRKMSAEVFILACGSVPIIPDIPGVDQPHVTSAHAVLSDQYEIGQEPVVVIGAGLTGLETADYLSEMGMTVTLVEMLDSPGKDIIPGIGVRELLLERLTDKKVQIITGHRALAVEEDSVVIADRPLKGGGNLGRISAASVVLSPGVTPNEEGFPLEALEHGTWYRIGDCHSPGNALKAIHAAFDLATRL
jgi:2,4-dienoyl-CoA reductase-like NADH-dependent reductase (Old Yellow Enzyme family)/thioredoxin reductase